MWHTLTWTVHDEDSTVFSLLFCHSNYFVSSFTTSVNLSDLTSISVQQLSFQHSLGSLSHSAFPNYLNFACTFSGRSTMIFSFQRNPPWSTQIKTVGIFNSATFCSACLDFIYYDHSRWWYFNHQSTNLLMFLYLGFKTGKNELTLR